MKAQSKIPKNLSDIPNHLKPYIVEQTPQNYTAIDQAVWRYIMRRLKTHLLTRAHEAYLEGLEKTGITEDAIPSIEDISQNLEAYGWRAAPVSGFIPPAAFMELQSLRILPIATAMRSIEHLEYTPAPDIVHEAAGHAPFLIHPEFSEYLTQYAEVARFAIINKDDLRLYDAIRELSDLKEDSRATAEQIRLAEERLEKVKSMMGPPSEVALLTRMNWWTAEYGLVGTPDDPKIYGAGLLSSVGESESCFNERVKKLPFSMECIDFQYDITEPQPQLFVARDFKSLSDVLTEIAQTLAFKKGGVEGLLKVQASQIENTVQLSSEIQISGRLSRFLDQRILSGEGRESRQPIYLFFEGPVQLCHGFEEIPNQGVRRHSQGFGTPVGLIKGNKKDPSLWTRQDFEALEILPKKQVSIEFESGIRVEGLFLSMISFNEKNLVMTFKDCRVTYQGQTLFDPSWGEFDMALGSTVTSCFAGPADRKNYGVTGSFSAKKVELVPLSPEKQILNQLYTQVRALRHKGILSDADFPELQKIYQTLNMQFPEDWLLKLELLEVLDGEPKQAAFAQEVKNELEQLMQKKNSLKDPIKKGLQLLKPLI